MDHRRIILFPRRLGLLSTVTTTYSSTRPAWRVLVRVAYTNMSPACLLQLAGRRCCAPSPSESQTDLGARAHAVAACNLGDVGGYSVVARSGAGVWSAVHRHVPLVADEARGIIFFARSRGHRLHDGPPVLAAPSFLFIRAALDLYRREAIETELSAGRCRDAFSHQRIPGLCCDFVDLIVDLAVLFCVVVVLLCVFAVRSLVDPAVFGVPRLVEHVFAPHRVVYKHRARARRLLCQVRRVAHERVPGAEERPELATRQKGQVGLRGAHVGDRHSAQVERVADEREHGAARRKARQVPARIAHGAGGTPERRRGIAVCVCTPCEGPHARAAQPLCLVAAVSAATRAHPGGTASSRTPPAPQRTHSSYALSNTARRSIYSSNAAQSAAASAREYSALASRAAHSTRAVGRSPGSA
ncbi:hypothetical protein CspHIS471_0510100 [Cutaneotrichosporon sp. HIS471]|nr:hypothetical protein CspHIS471_0510100 [Cutaneotrichosporon sp. HIS471]